MHVVIFLGKAIVHSVLLKLIHYQLFECFYEDVYKLHIKQNGR
jgi:hypothetical protein